MPASVPTELFVAALAVQFAVFLWLLDRPTARRRRWLRLYDEMIDQREARLREIEISDIRKDS